MAQVFWNSLFWYWPFLPKNSSLVYLKHTAVCRVTKSQSWKKSMENLEDASNHVERTKFQRSSCSSLIGLTCAFLNALFLATSSLIVKFLEESSPYQIQFACLSMQFIVLIPLMAYKNESIITSNWTTNCLLLIRGALGVPAYLCFLYGIKFLPLGDAVAISFCFVTLVGIFAWICLKGEKKSNKIVMFVMF